MKKILPLFLLLVVANYCMAAKTTKAKHKKATTKSANNKKKKTTTAPTVFEEYTGPLLKVSDTKSDNPGLAGFNVEGYYKITVLQTVTPAIHISGAEQPTIHVCVEGGKRGSCIDDLANGYGNMIWEAKATTKSYIAAYKPDGSKIPVKKELVNTNGKKAWKGNEFTWEDDQYKVKVKVSRCKLMPNGVPICPDK